MKTLMVMPTWKNETMCGEAIRTLYEYTDFAQYGDLVIIDNAPNGTHLANICAKYGARYRPQDENLRWMKSINRVADPGTELFTMCNDDVVFPQDRGFWPRTFELFEDPEVGGVGPISNYVMGAQYYQLPLPGQVGIVKFLIGFCATYRRYDFFALMGLDPDLPGGDDLDFSMRMRDRGLKLLCDRRSFLYHYGSVTGNRVHSDWDNHQSQLKTANALIRKHGLANWYDCVNGGWEVYLENEESKATGDLMGRINAELNKLAIYLSEKGVEVIEGSSTPKQMEYLASRVQGLKRVVEVGFNAGLSALTMLEANSDLRVISFDLGEWPCAHIAAAYLKDKYGDRFSIIFGDSKLTLLSAFVGETDLAFIDGGHDFFSALSDLTNLAPHAKLVVMDDMNMPEVARAWKHATNAGLVKQTGLYVDHEMVVPRHWAEGEGRQRESRNV